jgi:hypothetical protein
MNVQMVHLHKLAQLVAILMGFFARVLILMQPPVNSFFLTAQWIITLAVAEGCLFATDWRWFSWEGLFASAGRGYSCSPGVLWQAVR